jgi:hypothetical protein
MRETPVIAITNFLPMEEVKACFQVIQKLGFEKIVAKIHQEGVHALKIFVPIY